MSVKPDIEKIHKVLIVRWGALGDLALCSAVFQDLREQLPDAEFHLNTDPSWSILFESDDRFSRLVTLKMRGAGLRNALANWLALLRQEKYDLVIDLQSNDRSRFFLATSLFLGLAPRLRLSTRTVFPYNIQTPETNAEMHALEIFRVPLRALKLHPAHDKPVLFVSDDAKQRAENLLKEYRLSKGKFIIFVPGSSISGAHKRWGDKNYIDLGRALVDEKTVMQVAVLGGKSDAELCQSICDGIGEAAVNLAGQTVLDEITTIVDASFAVVANDTGLAHMAAATERPVVVICGPTLASRVKPAGNTVTAFQADNNCFASASGEDCMSLVTAEMVKSVFVKSGE
jgi:heptosyltransferase-2